MGRERPLLLALGALAAELQRARTQESLLRAAGEGLLALGFQLAAFRLEGKTLRNEYAALAPHTRQYFEETIGRSLASLRLPLAEAPHLRQVLETGGVQPIEALAEDVALMLRFLNRPVPVDLAAHMAAVGMQQGLVAAVRGERQPWGLLYLHTPALETHETAALSLFCTQLAATLEVVVALEEVQQSNRQLSAVHRLAVAASDARFEESIPRLLEVVREATAVDAAALYLVDDEGRTLVLAGEVGAQKDCVAAHGHLPLEGGPSGQVLTTRRTLVVARLEEAGEAQGPLETALVPMLVAGSTTGVLCLARLTRRPFTRVEVALAEALAAQLAGEVERARLQAERERQAEDLALIAEVGGLVSQPVELEEVLTTAMRHLSRLVEVPRVYLHLLEPEEGVLRVRAANIPLAQVDVPPLPLTGDSVAAEAVRTGRVVTVHDARSDPRPIAALARRLEHDALLGLPLLTRGVAVGALVLGETRGPRTFKRAEVERTLAVAHQLASALEKARLYEGERRRAEQLRLLVETSRVVTASLELEHILRTAAQSLTQLLEATDAFVWLKEGEEVQGVACAAAEYQESFRRERLPLSATPAVAAAIRERAPHAVEDFQATPLSPQLQGRYPMRSLLVLPLLLRDTVVGAVSIGDRRSARRFRPDEVERGLLVARQLAVALENARLFSDLKKSYDALARTQDKLVESERLAALGELSAVVAHEVRNPLAVIFNSLATLRRVWAGPPDGRVLLDILGEEAERLNRIVGDLLDFARPTTPRLRAEPLLPVVAGAMEAARRACSLEGVSLRVEVPERLPPVALDAELLRQLLVNLVVNAAQAMPRGGTLTVAARPEGEGVALAVTDTGPGVPDELQERIFQPFFTTRAAGTGLGLAVVKRIAEAHQASLSLFSRPGEGATFTLHLPPARPPEEGAPGGG